MTGEGVRDRFSPTNALRRRLTYKEMGNLALTEGFLRFLEREGAIAYYTNATGAYRERLTAAETLLSELLDIDTWLSFPF